VKTQDSHDMKTFWTCVVAAAVILIYAAMMYLVLPRMYNDNFLELAQEAEKPNHNFLFASNASLPGRIAMTLRGTDKPCINTATSFYNKYHTCSSCSDFVKNPERWNFTKVDQPEAGDMLIQHRPETGEAYHAAIIVKIEDGRYYINHAVRSDYFKNVELKNRSNLSFYRFMRTAR
jgi:hypothetical protein